MPKIVLLWTDMFIWALFLMCVLYGVRVVRHPNQRATWAKVFRAAAPLSATIVLAVFVVIGMLDSIHFRPRLAAVASAPGATANAPAYSTQTLSVLDLLLTHQRDSREKTYSAPLATRGFLKEVVDEGGVQTRAFPRLVYGGAHLANPERDRITDVCARAATGLVLGGLAGLLTMLLVAAWLARRRGGSLNTAWDEMLSGATRVPWRAVFWTVTVLSMCAGVLLSLAAVYHVFGTDRTGNDVFYQVIKSIRTALVMGSLTTAAILPFALVLGILSGYLKGWVDDVIQYFYTTLSSVPSVLLIAACVLLIQVFIDKNPQLFETGLERSDLKLLFLCLIVGLTEFATMCRLIRGEALKLRELDYVQAAQAFGASPYRIMSRHILPNVMHVVIITLVLEFSGIVLYEAVLSYVGVGVDPSTNSFGTMINLARSEMARDPVVWWNLATAFTFMLTLVLAVNLFADGVREAFDPRARVFRIPRPRSGAPLKPVRGGAR